MTHMRLMTPPHPDHWLDDGVTSVPRGMGTSLRVRSLDETLALAESLLPECGITRIADVTDLDRVGIDVYHSMRPLAMPGLNTVTSGKGTSKLAARTSAVMEAIERRWCEPSVTGLTASSYTELTDSGIAVLDPRRLIPRRTHSWTPDTQMTWCPIRELITSEVVLVPALSVFTPFSHEAGLYSSNTIGLAVGNTPKEALLHGLLELVEHDSTAFSETFRLGQQIELDSLPTEALRLVEMFHRADIAVDVFAYVTELNIPTIHVTIEDTRAQDGMLFNGGVGCHLDPQVALLRALTEAAQSRLNVIAGAREDFDRQAYRRHTSYAERKERYDAWRAGRARTSFEQLPCAGSADLDADLSTVVERLVSAGLGMLCVAELAPAGYPFSITKVVVPGMEVFHEDRQRMGTRLHRKVAAQYSQPLLAP